MGVPLLFRNYSCILSVRTRGSERTLVGRNRRYARRNWPDGLHERRRGKRVYYCLRIPGTERDISLGRNFNTPSVSQPTCAAPYATHASVKPAVPPEYAAYIGLGVHKDTIAVAIADPGRSEPIYEGEIAHTPKQIARLLDMLNPGKSLKSRPVPRPANSRQSHDIRSTRSDLGLSFIPASVLSSARKTYLQGRGEHLNSLICSGVAMVGVGTHFGPSISSAPSQTA